MRRKFFASIVAVGFMAIGLYATYMDEVPTFTSFVGILLFGVGTWIVYRLMKGSEKENED